MDYLETLRQQRIDDLDDLKSGSRESIHRLLEETYDCMTMNYYKGRDAVGLAGFILQGYDINVPVDVFCKFVYEYRLRYLDDVKAALHMTPNPDYYGKFAMAAYFVVHNSKMLSAVVLTPEDDELDVEDDLI